MTLPYRLTRGAAADLRVTTLPAVVVDRRHVVYGEPDVAKAVAHIEHYRRAQR